MKMKQFMQNTKIFKSHSHNGFSNKICSRMAGDPYRAGSGEGRSVTFRNIVTAFDINTLDIIRTLFLKNLHTTAIIFKY